MSTVHQKMLSFLTLDEIVSASMDRDRHGKPKRVRSDGAHRVRVSSQSLKRRLPADPSPAPAAGN